MCLINLLSKVDQVTGYTRRRCPVKQLLRAWLYIVSLYILLVCDSYYEEFEALDTSKLYRNVLYFPTYDNFMTNYRV